MPPPSITDPLPMPACTGARALPAADAVFR